ncbi:MAG TPA: hypothetical protein VEA59_05200, partial [Patescibacteria group bacterium]|nr:hypothetical protein [Patescibacteria group bacterium]
PDGVLCLFDYREAKLSDFIISGKYRFVPEIFEILGRLMASELKEEILGKLFTGFVVAPVPLHTGRKLWRGFNQSEVLAETIAIDLNIPYINVLRREKNTAVQKDLNKEQRAQNVKDAFSLDPGFEAAAPNVHVLLIDDVSTTGSTFLAAAGELKRAGFGKVWCLALASEH